MASEQVRDREAVVVIGSGPAAYAAALYLQEHEPLVLAGDYAHPSQYPGGQLTTTTAVDNYPGFAGDTSGPDLTDRFRAHVESTGNVRIEYFWVGAVRQDKGEFVLETAEGDVRAQAVIVATGSVARRLAVPGTGEGEFWNKGVSACATCDGWAFGGKDVLVIGGGDTAMEETLYLSRIARTVTLINRTDRFRARRDLLGRVRSLPNVTVLAWTVLKEVRGCECAEEVVIENTQSSTTETIPMDGVFFAIGHDPSTGLLQGTGIELTPAGYIVANKATMETSIPGMFAAGDVQDSKYRQAITAAYSGRIAAKYASEWLRRAGTQ